MTIWPIVQSFRNRRILKRHAWNRGSSYCVTVGKRTLNLTREIHKWLERTKRHKHVLTMNRSAASHHTCISKADFTICQVDVGLLDFLTGRNGIFTRDAFRWGFRTHNCRPWHQSFPWFQITCPNLGHFLEGELQVHQLVPTQKDHHNQSRRCIIPNPPPLLELPSPDTKNSYRTSTNSWMIRHAWSHIIHIVGRSQSRLNVCVPAWVQWIGNWLAKRGCQKEVYTHNKKCTYIAWSVWQTSLKCIPPQIHLCLPLYSQTAKDAKVGKPPVFPTGYALVSEASWCLVCEHRKLMSKYFIKAATTRCEKPTIFAHESTPHQTRKSHVWHPGYKILRTALVDSQRKEQEKQQANYFKS